MKRAWACLLLAFCLVFSQQGALLHGLRHHLPHPAAKAAAQPGAPAHQPSDGCGDCLAFAHAAWALATAPTIPALLSGQEHRVADEPFARLAAPAPDASARGPPLC